MKTYKTLNPRIVQECWILGKIKSDNEEQTKKAFQSVIESMQKGKSLTEAVEETKKSFGLNVECEIARKENKKPVYIIHIG